MQRLEPSPFVNIVTARETSHDAFPGLDQLARQQFMMNLDNRHAEVVVHRACPSMSANYERFREALLKVRDLFKTWKNRTLSNTQTIVNNIAVEEGLEGLQHMRTLQDLGDLLTSRFHQSWLNNVFSWATEAVNFDDYFHSELQWVRCKYEVITIYSNTNT
jgi:hypothetical protein